MNLEESVPPNVSSPLASEPELEVRGWKYTATESRGIEPAAKRLSVNVGTVSTPSTVPSVRSVGPIPRIPSN